MTCGCRGISSTSWWSTRSRSRPRRRPTTRRSRARSCGRGRASRWPSTGSRRSSRAGRRWSCAPGMTANLGFGICAMVPRILLEEGHPQAVTWAIEQGAVGGMPLTGFAFGCASNADAFVPSPSQFTYFQGGGFDVSFLSFLEVDVEGNVNVSKLGKKPYLTAGCGGFVDITANAQEDRLRRAVRGRGGARADRGALRVASPASSPRWSSGRARHLLRAPGAGDRAGGALRHRALRDPAGGRRAGRHRDHAGDRAAARHRRRSQRPGAPGAGRADPAGLPARDRARWGWCCEARGYAAHGAHDAMLLKYTA